MSNTKKLFDALQAAAFQCGYKVMETPKGLMVLPSRESYSAPDALLSCLLYDLVDHGYKIVSSPTDSERMWTNLVVDDGSVVSTVSLLLIPTPKALPSREASARISIMMFFIFMFGVVVSPGWWKLGAILILPPFYFAVEFVAKITGVL